LPKRIDKRALSWFLVLSFAILAGWYVTRNFEDFGKLRLASKTALLAIGGLFAMSLFLQGLFSLFVLRAFSVRLSLAECFSLSAATSMSNFLLPMRGGAGIRAVYLKKFHQLSYTMFLSTMATFYLLFVLVNTGLGLIGMLWICLTSGAFEWELLAITSGLFLLSAWAIFLAPSLPKGKGPFWGKVLAVGCGWDQIRKSRTLLSVTILIVTLNSICMMASYYFGFLAFSIPQRLPECLLIMSSQVVGGLVTLTPGAVGFQEVIGVYYARIIPASTTETLSVLATARIVRILTAIALGLPALLFLSRHQARRSREQERANEEPQIQEAHDENGRAMQ
jgi:uncharacterized membrane protein YbhN (UPF0104 family)